MLDFDLAAGTLARLTPQSVAFRSRAMISTVTDLREDATAALVGRRLVLMLVLLLVVLNLGGVLGVRTDTVTSTSGGYTLSLDE